MHNPESLVKITLTYKQLYDLYGNNQHEDPCTVTDELHVLTPSGLTKINSVVCKHDNPVIRLDFSDGDSFECSERHTFSTEGKEVQAINATEIDSVYGSKVVTEKTPLGIETVYDISIGAPHWYIATEGSGIIHHNTFFALAVVKAFLDADPKAQVIYWDTESAVTSQMLKSRGLDTKRIIILGVDTLEAFRSQAFKIVAAIKKQTKAERTPMMFVLDSLGMLSSDKEMVDVEKGTGKADMTKAKVAKSIFRVLTLALGHLNIPMIVTGHTYKTQELYAQDVLAGGTGLNYAASSIVFLSKSKEKATDGTIIGSNILCTLKKGRLTRENKQVRTLLNFDTGLNKHYGLLELAAKYEVFKKVSSKYVMPDGTSVFENAILKAPEKYFTKEVLDKLDEAAAREYLYGGDSLPDVPGEDDKEEQPEPSDTED